MEKSIARSLLVVSALLVSALPAFGQTLAPPFDTNYSIADLGVPSGVPPNLGALTFLAGDPNTLLISGSGSNAGAKLYSIAVTRDASNHITGFSGTATFVTNVNGTSGGIDGGLAYGPGGLLFYTSYPDNVLGEIKPGSMAPDKLVDLSAAGVASSVGTLVFVPPGFPGAGKFKIVQYSGAGNWYDATLSADMSGTFDVSATSYTVSTGGGPEGIIYIAAGNASFSVPSVLVSEYSAGRVSAFEIDGNGDPKPATRRDFITSLSGAEGAVSDPLTGDFLFSTFGGGNRVLVVRGFLAPSDSYLCYKAALAKGQPKFVKTSKPLKDQLGGPQTFDVKKIVSICNPVSQNGSAINDPTVHEEGYQIGAQKGAPKFVKSNHVTVDQFATRTLTLIKPDSLLDVTPKALGTTPPAQFATDPTVNQAINRFKCYKATLAKGQPKFVAPGSETLQDEFYVGGQLFDLKKVRKLCTPVDKNGETPGAETRANHLVCYQAKPHKGAPKFSRPMVATNSTNFGAQVLVASGPAELCVTATKDPSP